MNNRWKSSKHAVYNCAYHIIWCPKYRRKVLTGDIELRLKELIYQKSEEHGWIVENMEVMPDHIHIFIKATVVDAPVFIVSQLKGYTSFVLRNEFPKLKSRLPTLWTRSYYCETIGHISESTIKKYIDDQKNK
jgi:putative transposase